METEGNFQIALFLAIYGQTGSFEGCLFWMGYAAPAYPSIVCMSFFIRRIFTGVLPVLEFAVMCHFDAKLVYLTNEGWKRADTVP